MKTALAVIGLVVAIGAHDASRSQAAMRGSAGLYGASGRGDARVILASATGENKTEKACKKKADETKLNGIIRSDYIQRCISSRRLRDPNMPKGPEGPIEPDQPLRRGVARMATQCDQQDR